MGDRFVVSGGKVLSAGWFPSDSALEKVVSYRRDGQHQNLPNLRQKRWNHACATFTSNYGKPVSSQLQYLKNNEK